MTEDEEIAASVRKHGWHAITVEDGPMAPLLYTIGLGVTAGHPEIVVLGLEGGLAHHLVSLVVTAVFGGRGFSAGDRAEDLCVAFGAVHPTYRDRLMGRATAFYRHVGRPGALRALQLCWPDRDGRFPSDPGCDPRVADVQPSLAVPGHPATA